MSDETEYVLLKEHLFLKEAYCDLAYRACNPIVNFDQVQASMEITELKNIIKEANSDGLIHRFGRWWYE